MISHTGISSACKILSMNAAKRKIFRAITVGANVKRGRNNGASPAIMEVILLIGGVMLSLPAIGWRANWCYV